MNENNQTIATFPGFKDSQDRVQGTKHASIHAPYRRPLSRFTKKTGNAIKMLSAFLYENMTPQ